MMTVNRERKRQALPANAALEGEISRLAPMPEHLTAMNPVAGPAAGEPLPQEVRAYMEPRFGHDFGQVRIHVDAGAAQTAQALNARAYTVGQDIFFGPGEYAPQTDAGRHLLAHELSHVVQQPGEIAPGTPLVVGPVDDHYEREAEQVAAQVTATPFTGPAAARLSATAPAQVIRRSWLGSVLGGIGGAVLGAVGGFFIGGPAGAVIGGVAGLLGGAAAGDRLSQQRRSLRPDEIAYAREIYADSLDYSAITITKHSILSSGASRTVGNTINLEDAYYDGDTLNLTPEGKLILIHEMGHVWQYQHGGLAYIPESLVAQIRGSIGSGSRGAAYDWQEAIKAGTPWEKWNPEQQAEAIEDYNRALRRTRDGTATLQDYKDLSTLQPYIDKVRRGEGAPHGMLGAWLGGIGGAVGGFLAGGPVGAFFGGLGGLVGGSLLGAALK
ncbi:DUF4157 domain-containing protein [Thermogemmatispora carboxidivorans]|uniref:eCIS core domain-containing protein n=1 Tax=Thermogemmatispora carboxidivorans TaxID=1382306 RepID=UPI0009DD9A3B|nr:DUF4157 domain-containing protein [Thermogemmatispora carboxidivorans]